MTLDSTIGFGNLETVQICSKELNDINEYILANERLSEEEKNTLFTHYMNMRNDYLNQNIPLSSIERVYVALDKPGQIWDYKHFGTVAEYHTRLQASGRVI